jgi:hypothetical protein
MCKLLDSDGSDEGDGTSKGRLSSNLDFYGIAHRAFLLFFLPTHTVTPFFSRLSRQRKETTMPPKRVKKVMTIPINVIFSHLQVRDDDSVGKFDRMATHQHQHGSPPCSS